jgi:hypothetical protein
MSNSGANFESLLPTTVVNSSSTGGIETWKAHTTYSLNRLVQEAGIVYICKETHESGETFSGVGAHWEIVAGLGAVFACVPPTGVAATDTKNVEATFTAASASNGAAFFLHAGAYNINVKELVRPHNISIVGTADTIFRAQAGCEILLSDSLTEKTEYKSIVGGLRLDANNIAKHALWCRFFNHMVFGVKPYNSLEDDWILGDSNAAAASAEPVFTDECLVQRTTGSVPVGHYCIWAQNASDGRMPGTVMTGQETGLRVDNGGWRGFGVHPVGAGFPMQVGIDDHSGGNEWHGTNLDTMTGKEHAGATGEAASSTITDAEILAQHLNRPVSGVNIPAGSFVGTVTPGVSFNLVNAKNVAVKPTGVVTGIRLNGVGCLMRFTGGGLVGGLGLVNTTYGNDNDMYGMIIGPQSTGNYALGFRARGGNAEHRLIQAFAGNTSVLTWVGLMQQENCVNTQVVTQLTGTATGTTAAEKDNSATLATTAYADRAAAAGGTPLEPSIILANTTYNIPTGAKYLQAVAVGGGGGGAGAGSAAAAQLQTGGGGGAAGVSARRMLKVGESTTAEVVVGAGGAGGNGGAAGGTEGVGGTQGSESRVKVGATTVKGLGGAPGAKSTASSTTIAGGGVYGGNGAATGVAVGGSGGGSALGGGKNIDATGGGGAGGGTATATNGGSGGGAGTEIAGGTAGTSGGSGTSAGGEGATAAANTAAGGGGGGGGAAGTGAGGKGGEGGSGYVVIQPIA